MDLEMMLGYVFRLSRTPMKTLSGVVVVFVWDTGVQIWRRKIGDPDAQHLTDALSSTDVSALVDLLTDLRPGTLINYATKDLWRLLVVDLGQSDSDRLTFVEDVLVPIPEPSSAMFRYQVEAYFNKYRDEDRRRNP